MSAEQQAVELGQQGHEPSGRTTTLTIGALGVVYGDIGTSPIYALREALRAAAGDRPPTDIEVLGVLSIIVWSLTIVVAIKYALVVLRADNHGEGGTLSIMALARAGAPELRRTILLAGIVGASLFYGDAIITPAISVLSAVEGLEVVAPDLDTAVLPITIAILLTLFAVQRFGTARVALVFGPVTALWFLALLVSGGVQIAANPGVLAALDPLQAVSFLQNHTGVAFAVIGAAFLAVTGAEALYADLGHFGRRPIVIAWFGLAFPALLVSYFGQGAYVLSHGGDIGQPLFEMVPALAILPLVVLATAATVIASQATISGAFSLTSQAIQLGLLPRLEVRHTSESQSGQIYMPQVNMLLLIGVVILVLEFGTSSALAAAYGISVTGVMVVTTLLLAIVMWRIWKLPAWLAVLIALPFLVIDLSFLAANLSRIAEGGWVTVALGAAMLVLMITWRRGSNLLFGRTRKLEVPLAELADMLAAKPPAIVPGTAVFLTSDPRSAPTALMHSLKHYKVLHERNVILTVVFSDRPHVAPEDGIEMTELNGMFRRVTLTFGYMDQPNVPRALAVCRRMGWKFDIMTTSFFLSRRALKATANPDMRMWQKRLFVGLARNASDAAAFFHIPTGRAVEIGTQVII